MVGAVDIHWSVSGEDYPWGSLAVNAGQMTVQELVLERGWVKSMFCAHEDKVDRPVVKSIPE